MRHVRDIVSEALKLRQEKNIKVRQPLSVLKVKYQSSDIPHMPELVEIIKDEVNVKKS
ncbi:MAG: hypothetical protein WDN09_00250 [bacterium]